MDTKITDQATATTALNVAREHLTVRMTAAKDAMDHLRSLIVKVRTSGLLSVDDMAAAIDRDRNYVDSVWSTHGETSKGKQTRIPVQDTNEPAARLAAETLAVASATQRRAADHVTTARAERDRVVALVYASKLLGPTAISEVVQVDRNHVLRIARRLGQAPAHRMASRNQYSA